MAQVCGTVVNYSTCLGVSNNASSCKIFTEYFWEKQSDNALWADVWLANMSTVLTWQIFWSHRWLLFEPRHSNPKPILESDYHYWRCTLYCSTVHTLVLVVPKTLKLNSLEHAHNQKSLGSKTICLPFKYQFIAISTEYYQTQEINNICQINWPPFPFQILCTFSHWI